MIIENQIPTLPRFETNHDYDVPAIITFQTNANESYGIWLDKQLN